MIASLSTFSRTVKSRKRRARGGCYGGTSGRGHKGYKARSGSVVKGFEGGQTPIYRRLPMRGFNSRKEKDYEVVSLKRVIFLARNGDVDVDNNILAKNNVIKSCNSKTKLIGSDVNETDVKKIKRISVNLASSSVVEFLKKNGVELVLSN